MKRINILIADDHKLLREGLRSLLERNEEFIIVGEADNGRAAVELTLKLAPQVVLMDVAMPDLNGMEATRQICSSLPETRVIAMSMHSDRRFITGMLTAGASAYVLKASAFEEVITAIQAVMTGRIYASPKITDLVLKDYVLHLSKKPLQADKPLTSREREVLQLLAEGWTTREIAQKLHVSANTVDTHRRNIQDKLEIRTMAELTKYAIREGLTTLDG